MKKHVVAAFAFVFGCGDSEDDNADTGTATDVMTVGAGPGTGVGPGSGPTSMSAGPSTSGSDTDPDTGETSDTTGAGGQSFEERCAGADVISCWSFDSAEETDPYLNDSGFSAPAWDGTTPAEGGGSIYMQVLPGSPADTSGSAVLDFAEAVGPGESLYLQWRQRFSQEFLATDFDANGWKQLLFHENTSTAGCSDSEVVVTNRYNGRYPTIYHACNIFHGLTENPVDGNEFEFSYQPGGDNQCLWSWLNDDDIDHLEPSDDVEGTACIGYEPDQWMTFQVAIHHNGWCSGIPYEDCPEDSRIEMWVTYEGEAPVQVIDWPVALITTTDPVSTAYDSVQITPYNTDKSTSQQHANGELWYDSVIVSRARIPEP